MHSASHAAAIPTQTVAPWTRQSIPLLLSISSCSLVLAVVLGMIQNDGMKSLSHSYLVAFSYCLSLSLGSLFFIAIQHITRAGWSVTIRRFAEMTGVVITPLAILFLPILIPVMAGASPLYVWSHADVVAHDELLQNKSAYLNPTFFTIRWLLYFTLWTVIARWFLRCSRAQDADGSPKWTDHLEQYSGPAVIVLALSATFASFDILMSLDPHWFSTIYGVYFFAGSMVTFFAVATVAINLFQRAGYLQDVITTEHIHDVGKLLFGFNCFWAYIAFSQYLLIWYANIPEETQWYLRRETNGWEVISLVLIFGHFAIPFLGMMSRDVKRNLSSLTGWAVWLLVMQWVDLYWLVVPQGTAGGPRFGLIDISCFVGCGGLYLATWLWMSRSCPLVPARDPRLPESLAFHNI